ncbi:4-hydroxy-tetrahydrodipicolinate synthase [Acetomicrobium sp. S15 = DSM 107314]|jgi:4-hydroxy-tetrahydrodipicolinate synthase|uniref:4-hydroxy-tetrahydrodipicolinate synthase n=1 Tax=Acetomicrobium sp. S15 = DSM 107314 TaxID=2529858 RepID=UPI0018E10929|nr:4-hydroxy-tetrahydrodipicolinate synthase [Acetomicrobium sp. S15 = DSM 107314]
MTFAPRGILPAMVTPLNDREEVNEKALRSLVDFLVDNGVHGIFVVGSQGEAYALSRDEKKKVMETAVEQAAERVPVYAGTGAVTTREAVELTRMAEGIGVDAVSVITPYFLSPSQEELYEYYKIIANSTSLPILLYNNPGKTGGVSISVGLAERLSQIENIVGIKDSSGDMTLTGEYIRKTRDKGFSVLAGRDTLILSTLLYGGSGAISATANVAPKIAVDIYEHFVKGDIEKAREAQFALAPLRVAFELGTFPVVIKEALKIIGIDAGPAKSPVKDLSDAKRQELKEILKGMGLL